MSMWKQIEKKSTTPRSVAYLFINKQNRGLLQYLFLQKTNTQHKLNSV